MLLLVGLGNPGPEYARNRHNLGFMAVDAIVRRHGFGPFRRKFQGEISAGELDGHRTLALKPMTYMNESGRAVAAAMAFHRIPVGDVLVVHDEIELPAGKVRVKTGGGNAGHNGLRSISAHVGPEFRRVRLGVGRPAGRDRVTGHVLDDFAKVDAEWLGKLLDAVAEHAPRLASGDDSGFMNKISLALNPPGPRPAAGREGGDEGDGL